MSFPFKDVKYVTLRAFAFIAKMGIICHQMTATCVLLLFLVVLSAMIILNVSSAYKAIIWIPLTSANYALTLKDVLAA